MGPVASWGRDLGKGGKVIYLLSLCFSSNLSRGESAPYVVSKRTAKALGALGRNCHSVPP